MPDVADEATAPEPAEESEAAGWPDASSPPSRRSASWLVAVLAIAVVGIAVAAGLTLGGGGQSDQPPGGSTPNPTGALESALAAGTPVYILIHSST